MGLAYTANQMRIPADLSDPRVTHILDALDGCL